MRYTTEQINKMRKESLISDIELNKKADWKTVTRRSVVVDSMKQRLDRLEQL